MNRPSIIEFQYRLEATRSCVTRDDPAAQDADGIGDDGQHRAHEEAGQHPRHDQLAHRVGAERAQRVDLVGDDHRAELGGDARSDAAGQHQGRSAPGPSSLTIDALISRPTNARAPN